MNMYKQKNVGDAQNMIIVNVETGGVNAKH